MWVVEALDPQTTVARGALRLPERQRGVRPVWAWAGTGPPLSSSRRAEEAEVRQQRATEIAAAIRPRRKTMRNCGCSCLGAQTRLRCSLNK